MDRTLDMIPILEAWLALAGATFLWSMFVLYRVVGSDADAMLDEWKMVAFLAICSTALPFAVMAALLMFSINHWKDINGNS